MKNQKFLVHIVGFLFIAAAFYCCVTVLLFCICAFSLSKGVTFDVPILRDYQRRFYDKGYRNIWQASSDCIIYDEQLAYLPKPGKSHFKNPEFDTELNFGKQGRMHKKIISNKPGIAVLGDSYAMGWGVSDEETFSAELQNIMHRPVYNLGVSSYGTHREFLLLERSGILDTIDTIVLQYCANDLDENTSFAKKEQTPPTPTSTNNEQTNIAAKSPQDNTKKETSSDTIKNTKEKLRQAKHEDTYEALKRLGTYLKYALLRPIPILSEDLFTYEISFADHYEPMIKVLDKKDYLKDKKIFIFYLNKRNKQFPDFPEGTDKKRGNIHFFSLDLTKDDFFVVDDHITPRGHKRVAEQIARVLKKNGVQ